MDSHSRDLSGMIHLYRTCTLIEIDSWINLAQYFHIHKSKNQKSKLLDERKQKYNDMEPEAKRQKIDNLEEQQKEARKSEANQTYSLNHYIAILKQKIREGPYYICSVCNRILHRKSVLILVKSKYNRNIFLQIVLGWWRVYL